MFLHGGAGGGDRRDGRGDRRHERRRRALAAAWAHGRRHVRAPPLLACLLAGGIPLKRASPTVPPTPPAPPPNSSLHLGILMENMRREGYEFEVRAAPPAVHLSALRDE